MLNQQTIEKPAPCGCAAWPMPLPNNRKSHEQRRLSFEERFALLVDRQWNWRQNQALEQQLREGRLQGPACMEDIDFRAARVWTSKWCVR